MTSGSLVSTSNVCSWPTDFAGSPSWTGSASMPRARSTSDAAVLAEPPHEEVRRQRRQVADRPDAVLAQGRPRSSRRRPTAARSAAARGTPPPRRRGTTTSPSGLRRSDAILATSFVLATPTDAVSPTSARIASLIRRAIVGPSPNRAAEPGDVEERLVDRDRLDQRREPPEDRHDVAAGLPGSGGRRPAGRPRPGSAGTPRAATSPSGRRTAAPRSSRPRRRPRASSPPAPPTMTGMPRSSGSIALLDGGEERVEVDVEDRPRGHGRYHRPAVEPPADAARRSPRRRRPGLAVVADRAIGGRCWRGHPGHRRRRVVAWLVPPTAVVLVWPILFFVPGWVVVRRVVPDLPLPGAVGAAVVTSVYVSAHLVNLVARVGGFGRGVDHRVGRAAGVAARSSSLGSGIDGSRRCTRPTRAGVGAALRADAPAWIVAAATGLVVLVVLWSNGWLETPDGWVTGGWNWSDLLVHVSIGSSIAAGNFPPEVPYFAGEPLTYHWFADFHGAIASTAAGVDVIPVYFVTARCSPAVLALVVWALAVRLTGGPAGGHDRDDPRLLRRRAGLDPAGRRRHRRWRRRRRPRQPRSPTTTPGSMAGRTSRSPRSSGRASCRTARRPWACPGS